MSLQKNEKMGSLNNDQVIYQAPEGFTPMMVGLLFDDKFTLRDIYAGIIHLAQEGYLQVIPKLSGNPLVRPRCTLRLVRAVDSTLARPEQVLLQSLFSESDTVEDFGVFRKRAHWSPYNFFLQLHPIPHFNEVARSTEQSLVSLGMFNKATMNRKEDDSGRFKKVVWSLLGAMVVAVSLLGIVPNQELARTLSVMVTCAVVIVMLVLFYIPIERTITQRGEETRKQLKKLREYLQTVESSRYGYFANPRSRPEDINFYEGQAYAITMGVELQWREFFDEVLDIKRYGIGGRYNLAYKFF